jgi:selenocysteine lyase/cysteine desulfurase
VSLEGYLAAFHEDPLYLNHASYGPPSADVVATGHRLLELSAVGGPDVSARLHAEDARAIAAIARLTGAPVEHVALTANTSLGLMQVAFGIGGGDVLLSADEFPSNVYAWLRARDAGLLGVRTLEPDASGRPLRVTPDAVAAALTPQTVAVAVSAVDFRTGFVDWSLADALVVGGQKWLRAGWGAGFLVFSERGIDRIAPTLGGWTGVENPTLYDGAEHAPLPGAAAHSITNLSPFATGALATALELVEGAGVAAIAGRIAETADALAFALDEVGVAVLSPRDPAERAGIVVAGIPGDRAPLAHRALADAGVTTTLHGSDRIRLSVHATTTTAAVETAAAILGESA